MCPHPKPSPGDSVPLNTRTLLTSPEYGDLATLWGGHNRKNSTPNQGCIGQNQLGNFPLSWGSKGHKTPARHIFRKLLKCTRFCAKCSAFIISIPKGKRITRIPQRSWSTERATELLKVTQQQIVELKFELQAASGAFTRNHMVCQRQPTPPSPKALDCPLVLTLEAA